MPSSTKKILFLSHAASRSGAPILLLQLLQWFKQNSDLELNVWLKQGGPLQADFAAVAPVTLLEFSRAEQFCAKICRRLKMPLPRSLTVDGKLADLARSNRFDLIYGNTVAVADEVAVLGRQGLPVIWHLHEMPFAIRCLAGRNKMEESRRHVRRYIAASAGVREGLTRDFGVPDKQIDFIYGFIRPVEMEEPARLSFRHAVRQELNMPENAFVAGMCGTVEWRKGADWFITVAKQVAMQYPDRPIVFVWIGGADSAVGQLQMEHDVRLAGLSESVKFIGAKPDSVRYLAALDVFLLSSREDPFPLAMLEAASVGLPILCFDGTGGGPEFVGADAGVIVEYASVGGMARTVADLSQQPETCRVMGAVARQKVRERFSLDVQAPKILEVIDQTLGERSPRADKMSK